MTAKGPFFQPGQMLPGTKYQVVRQLGAGGMGIVYQVVKPPQIQGVLKLMSAELTQHPEFRTRFFDEVRILAQLDHPNIVRVWDYDSLSDGTPYYVMEMLNGRTVRDVLATLGRVPPRVAYEVTRQLLEALHCAHTHSVPVVHRDIKPENIFLHAPRHGEPVVKLIDFGVIAVADRKHDGSFVGTWRYAAPEQIRGEMASPATDLYAVGLVLYEMLCGLGPFDHLETGPMVSSAHLHDIPTPVSKFAPWVPASIVTLIQAALAKDVRVRPKDAYAFAERLFELEWATDGKDPHDATAEGPPAAALEMAGRGPLSRVLSSASAAKPSSKNLAAAAPAADRRGDVPLIGVPPEALHAGPTLRGVGDGKSRELTSLTSPDEDALLEGYSGRDDRKPLSKRARESGRELEEASPSPAPPASRPKLPSGAMDKDGAIVLGATTLEANERPGSDVAIATPQSARTNDTFSSQQSDARPARKSNRLVYHAAAATLVVLAVASLLLLRHRASATASTEPAPPPPPATAAAPPLPEQPSTASATATAAVGVATPPTATTASVAVPSRHSPSGGSAKLPAHAVTSGNAPPPASPPPQPQPTAPAAPSSSGTWHRNDYARGM
jgi:eukaryotic-like serine/threonine-protein kinase